MGMGITRSENRGWREQDEANVCAVLHWCPGRREFADRCRSLHFGERGDGKS